MDGIFIQEGFAKGPADAAPSTGLVRYDTISQVLHWSTAALIFTLVPLGLVAAHIPDGPTRSALLDSWHKPIGITALVLTIIRFGWRTRVSRPAHSARLRRWEKTLARIVHVLLYALLLSMPLSGLLMSEGAGRPISYFGLFHLPQVLPLDTALKPREQYYYILGKKLHEGFIVWSLYFAVVLHIGGVIKHRVFDRDRDSLSRMLSSPRAVSRG